MKHRTIDVTMALALLGAFSVFLLCTGCDAAANGVDSIQANVDPQPKLDDVAWCAAFELARESCPLTEADDPASEQTQGYIAKGCTDVAMAATGTIDGRSELSGAILSCHGVGDPGSCWTWTDWCSGLPSDLSPP